MNGDDGSGLRPTGLAYADGSPHITETERLIKEAIIINIINIINYQYRLINYQYN